MTSLTMLQKQVKQLRDKTSPDKIGIAWQTRHDISIDGKTFYSMEQFNKYITEKRFTRVHIVGWEEELNGN